MKTASESHTGWASLSPNTSAVDFSAWRLILKTYIAVHVVIFCFSELDFLGIK